MPETWHEKLAPEKEEKNGTSFVSVSNRRPDVKPKQDSDPEKNHSVKIRKEKHNDEHRNKNRHGDDPSLEEPQDKKHHHEIRNVAEDAQLEIDVKTQKHVQDHQREKHKPEPKKERLSEDPKKMRRIEEVKKEKHPEEPKKHSYPDDMKKDKPRHERLMNPQQRERPPTEPQREKPADVHKPVFERWEQNGSIW